MTLFNDFLKQCGDIPVKDISGITDDEFAEMAFEACRFFLKRRPTDAEIFIATKFFAIGGWITLQNQKATKQ